MNVNFKEYILLCSIPAVQEKIISYSKEWHDNDLVLCQERQSAEYITTYEKHSQGCNCEPRWIPQVHDLMDEKRGLWGMVDWFNTKFIAQGDGSVAVGRYDGRWWHHIYTGTPEIALLRALMHQWGIKE